jgi:hypothetical protein
MSGDVIEFHRPIRQLKQVEVAKPMPKLADAKERGEWTAALAAIWANPKNWKRSRKGNAYIVIDDLNICVVISRDESGGGFQWEIRWRWGGSRWCRNGSSSPNSAPSTWRGKLSARWREDGEMMRPKRAITPFRRMT